MLGTIFLRQKAEEAHPGFEYASADSDRQCIVSPSTHRNPHLTLLLLGLLEDLLDDLLLLDQEGTDDTVLDAVGAPRATVGTLDGLLRARDSGVLVGAEGRDLLRIISLYIEDYFPGIMGFRVSNALVGRCCPCGRRTWSLQEKSPKRFHHNIAVVPPRIRIVRSSHNVQKDRDPLTPASLEPQSPHLGAVPFFLMWR